MISGLRLEARQNPSRLPARLGKLSDSTMLTSALAITLLFNAPASVIRFSSGKYHCWAIFFSWGCGRMLSLIYLK